MKKFLCVLMVMAMMCTAFAAVAETTSFDKSKLTGSTLYHYDKFTKEWSIQGTFTKQYRDCRIHVALLLFDPSVEESIPELRVVYFDKETQQYDVVTAFRVVVDGRIFCFEKMWLGNNSSSVYGGNVLKALCTALISGHDIAFQIDHTDMYGSSWTVTIDPVDRAALAELIEMGMLLRDSNAWSLDTMPLLWDAYSEATME